MTKRATTTQADVQRLIKAVLQSGLPVAGVIRKPDGTVVVTTVPLAPADVPLGQDSEVML